MLLIINDKESECYFFYTATKVGDIFFLPVCHQASCVCIQITFSLQSKAKLTLDVRVTVSISFKDLCFYSKSWAFKQMSKVDGTASRRGVACHIHPVHPALRGQTPSRAGHWVLGHTVTEDSACSIWDMSYNHENMVSVYRLTSELTSCPQQSPRSTVAVIYGCTEDAKGSACCNQCWSLCLWSTVIKFELLMV